VNGSRNHKEREGIKVGEHLYKRNGDPL